ncbi:MAG: hypothetical protein ACXU8U_13445 [Asticcacaulis sp.]
MAKGQKKSSRETRKPKQPKVAAAPAAGNFSKGVLATGGAKPKA